MMRSCSNVSLRGHEERAQDLPQSEGGHQCATVESG